MTAPRHHHHKGRNCKCAIASCGHCRKHHDGPNGECSKCACKGWI